MNTDKNPRADSKLKRLDEAVHQEMFTRLMQPGVKQADVLAWLRKEHGVKCSGPTLSDWLSWYSMRLRARQREQKIQAFLEDQKLLHPELSDDQLFKMGQRMFSLATMADEDADGWTKVQKAVDQREQRTLEGKKFQRETCELFRKWYADEAMKSIMSDKSLSGEAQMEGIGQRMFGELWNS